MSNNALMLHTGGYTTSISDVIAVRTPAPTDTHYPIAHSALIGLTIEALEDTGYHIQSQAHALAVGGMNYFGLFELRGDSDDSALVVGLRNSHVMKFRAGLVAGSRIFVCDNLAFAGEVQFGRKHTLNIARDIPALVTQAVGRIGDLRQTEAMRTERYQNTPCLQAEADQLMMSMIRNQVIPASKIGMVCEDFMHPTRRHPEFGQYVKSVYGLYMAATEHMKSAVFHLPKRSKGLHALLDGACQTEQAVAYRNYEPANDDVSWEAA